jgi:vitamin B12/bleomycin/antimicrobial peptide transport system ATP-binding/permease protein
LFIRGEVEFGVITQSAMAFSVLLGALSLVVTQFQSISSFAAVIARLGSPGNDHALVRDLSVSVPHGRMALIVGPNDAAKVALLRATAAIWEHGSGSIVRLGLYAILFLPERPYLPRERSGR